MLQRIKQAYEAGRRAADDRGTPASEASKRAGRPCLALLALDLPDAAVRQLADRHASAAQRAGTRALLITSATATDIFLRPDLVCERLPLLADLRLASDDPTELLLQYLRRRLHHILDKWSVTDCMWAGNASAELIGAGSTFPEGNIRCHALI
jgi:hypothetical protein